MLEWWYDVGVDILVDDLLCDWFVVFELLVVVVLMVVVMLLVVVFVVMFLVLVDFFVWWIGVQVFESGWNGLLIVVSGLVDVVVMILVDCLECDDIDMLMSGLEGWLFDWMLVVIGLLCMEIYFVVVCVKCLIVGCVVQEVEMQFVEIVWYYIGLVVFKCLLLMGNVVSCVIFMMDVFSVCGCLYEFNYKMG